MDIRHLTVANGSNKSSITRLQGLREATERKVKSGEIGRVCDCSIFRFVTDSTGSGTRFDGLTGITFF